MRAAGFGNEANDYIAPGGRSELGIVSHLQVSGDGGAQYATKALRMYSSVNNDYSEAKYNNILMPHSQKEAPHASPRTSAHA